LFVNAPTVQELLHDCAREVRSIMWDVTTLDGPALAAAWPAFAAHAEAALAAVPPPDPATQLLASRMRGPRSRPNRWGPPVEAEPDPHLMAAGDALAAVADLLHRHATPPKSIRAVRDADLARRRIAECLFIGSHATALGLHEHAARLRPARPGIAFEQPGVQLAVAGATLAKSRRLASELDTLQAHAAHYLAGARGREPRPGAEHFVDPDRLPHVLAAWEVTALRVLHASPPSVRDLAGVAHAEQALLVHTMVILNAAAEAGVIDHDGFTRQIRPRLQDAHLGWGEVAASWPALMSTRAPVALVGVEASAQLHRALADITRDGTGWAKPDLIAARVHLAEVTGLLRDAIGAGCARAGRFAELPSELARAGQIQAPARLLAAMEPHPGRRGPELQSAPRISDVANRRIVLVRPEQTTGATTTARDLGRHMTSLTQALETLPLGRASLAVVGPAPSAQSAARGARPARSPLRNTPLGRNVTAR
jgi:hypothetical protein